MSRPDLLALSADDLATLTNRGTVKRAQREVEASEVAGEMTETAEGDVAVRWSDGPECKLPAGVALAMPPAPVRLLVCAGISIRAVLYYQKHTTPAAGEQSVAASGPWDPGAIADEELHAHYRAGQLTKAREQLEQGLLVEPVRGTKPSARFHLQGCLLRFLVPGDVRYTHCDCGETAPCSHVPLAIWAFRRSPTALSRHPFSRRAAGRCLCLWRHSIV